MAQKSSYTDIVHNIVRDAEETLDLKEVIDLLLEAEPDNPPKNPRSTVRSAVRSSGLIMPAGKSRFGWLPKGIEGARLRHTLSSADFEGRRLTWDTDLLIAQWPAAEEPETRRSREPIVWETDAGGQFTLELVHEDQAFHSVPDPTLWAWLSEQKAEAGGDIIVTATDPMNSKFSIRWEARGQRNVDLIEERNKQLKRRIDNFLTTQREGLAKPRMIAADLLANKAFHDSIPPQSLSNILPKEVSARYGASVPVDDLKQEKSSNVIPFPNKNGDSAEGVRPAEADTPGSVELDIPLNTGQELPDDRAYAQSMELLADASATSPALAIHMLGISRLCSPAYAMLSQTAEYRKEALELAGQSVIAAERRISHGLIESLVSDQEFAIEEAIATYLEARSFLARALWHGGNFDEAIEQAMHCFEIDPEDPHVREDLFVMLFDSDRHEMVLSLLESFPGASVTEDLYHRALSALLDDPDSKDATKRLRKAVSHNGYLASLFLGEEPKKSKRSSMDEALAYESAYGFLWRREDHVFDLLEEIVLARR